jgi:hypothetical protein
VHICHSGGSCLAKLAELQNSSKSNTPTIVLIDVPYDEEQRLKRLSREPRSPSPTSLRSKRRITTDSIEPNDIYGMHLLTHIASEIKIKKMSTLIVPIVVLSGFERDWATSALPSPSVHGSQVLSDTVRLTRYLDAGAADVLTSPLSKDNAQGLAVHAYRASRSFTKDDAAFLGKNSNRRLSWVGVEEAKPYAYLREAMVSSLMGGICNPESALEDPFESEYYSQLCTSAWSALTDFRDLNIPDDRKDAVTNAVASWSFGAHDFTDDELLHGGLIMLQHVLEMPELEKFRMGTGKTTARVQRQLQHTDSSR